MLHLARTVADATIADKTADEFTAVLRPKVDGTVALDLAVGAAPLDFFVMFSSLAAWIGLAGASDYACACAFQDHFAATRQGLVDAGQRHGRTVAIAWPQWAYDRFLTADKAQALDRLGLVPVDAQRGLQILDAALSSTATAVAALVGDASRFDGLLARSSPGGLAEELAALSDDATAGFAFVSGHLAFRGVDERIARAWLCAALLVGTAFGLAQQWRGAHFMSHTQWSAVTCWWVALAGDALRRSAERRWPYLDRASDD